MHSTKLIVACLAVVLVAVVLFSVAVAAVTAAPNYPETASVVIAEKGIVEVQKGGAGDWTKVADSMDVEAGDKVRTGAGGSASVEYFDEGVSRLDANTEITIEELFWDPVSGMFVGTVKLETGRLWSRLFNFLSPESGYEVQTGSTVATVRGTAFFVAKGKGGVDSVFVDDHEVTVSAADGGSSRLIEAGRKVRVLQPTPGAPHVIFPSYSQELDDLDFISENRKLDREFHTRVMKKKQAELENLRVLKPDSPFYGFISLAERTRLTFTFDAEQKEQLKKRFAIGRVVDAEMLLGADNDRATAIIKEAMAIDPDAEFAFEQMEARKIFSYASGWEKPSIEESGLVPQRGTVESKPPADEPINVAPTRDSAPVVEPEAVFEPKTIYTIEDGGLVPQKPIYEPEQGTEPAPEPILAELVLSADRPIIGDNETSVVRAYLVASDDTQKDVSAFVKWTVIGAGNMEGNLFVPDGLGSIVVKAVYPFEGTDLVGATSLRVFDAPETEPEPEPDVSPSVDETSSNDTGAAAYYDDQLK